MPPKSGPLEMTFTLIHASTDRYLRTLRYTSQLRHLMFHFSDQKLSLEGKIRNSCRLVAVNVRLLLALIDVLYE